ncbi:MAG: hypothetical protein ACE5EG_09845 [Thermoanaerobaculia bacterium]
MEPRYPQIHVHTRSRNPLTLVAAIREELRRARAGDDEIRRFSRQALAFREPARIREVCRSWAVVDNGA